MREFWEATIYGRQSQPADFHVSLMYTPEFIDLLQSSGFKDISYAPEDGEEWNTIVLAHRGEIPVTYEDALNKEVLNV
jgi:hypothetical protein